MPPQEPKTQFDHDRPKTRKDSHRRRQRRPLLKAAKMHLKRHFAQVDIEKNPEAIPALMNNEDYDVILLDMNLRRM